MTDDLLKRPGPAPAVVPAGETVPERNDVAGDTVPERDVPTGNPVPDPRQRPARGPAASRRWRRWGFVAGAALLAYWPAAFVFLNTPLGEWVVNGGWSARPRKVRMVWASGSSWWPGRFTLEGVELRGQSRRMDWQLRAQEASGRLVFTQLLSRRVLLEDVRGRAATFNLERRATELAEAPPRPRRWSVELPEIELSEVYDLGFGGWSLGGEAEARGGFFYRAGEVSLEGARFVLQAGRLESRGRELARELVASGEATLSPYVPREQPGPLGLDFLTGNLTASGLAGPAGDPFTTELQVREGRFEPGSRLNYRSSSGAGRLDYAARVETTPSGDQLRLEIDATQLEIGPRQGEPPLLTSARLEVNAQTADTRLASLFGRARELGQTSGPSPGGESSPLVGELTAEDLRLHLAGERLAVELAVTRASGRLDLGAFLHRELAVEGLKAEGGALKLVSRSAAAETEPPPPLWALRFPDAQLQGLAAVSLDQLKLAGPLRLGASFSLSPKGEARVDAATLSLPQGTLSEGAETLARKVAVELSARATPLAAGELSAARLLPALSGEINAKADVESLGFLRQWLGKNPWWGLEGRGRLEARLAIEAGRLLPGSRIEVKASAFEERLLGSIARGRGGIEARVVGDGDHSRLEMVARLDRFTVEDEVRARLLEGSGLVLSLASEQAVRLGSPPTDLMATIDLERATMPNFAMLNPLLPGGADLELLPGTGTFGLRLEIDGKNQTGRGRFTLESANARMRIEELVVGGRLRLVAPLVTDALAERRFGLAGTRLTLEGGSYREVNEAPEPGATGWWARLDLPQAELTMGRPVAFASRLDVEMRDSGPFLALFAQKRRYLNWFSQVLLVEGVRARAELKLSAQGLEVDPLNVQAETLSAIARMRFGQGAKQGDLFLALGKLEVGVELRDGKRDLKILNPRKWLETWHQPP